MASRRQQREQPGPHDAALRSMRSAIGSAAGPSGGGLRRGRAFGREEFVLRKQVAGDGGHVVRVRPTAGLKAACVLLIAAMLIQAGTYFGSRSVTRRNTVSASSGLSWRW